MKKLEDFIKTCQVLKLNPIPTKNKVLPDGSRTKTLSMKDCITAIQNYYVAERKLRGTYRPALDILLKMDSPMLALQIKNLKPEVQKEIWDDESPNWIWEEKIDGCRALVYFDPKTGFDVYSRNLSVNEQLPISYGEKILWPEMNTSGLTIPFMIDCEIVPKNKEIDKSGALVPVADTQLNLISSILSLNEEDSKAIQLTNPVKFMAFDVIMVGGETLFEKPLSERKKILNLLYKYLYNAGFPIEFPQALQPGQSKQEFYNNILAAGGEGVVAKDLRTKYDILGKRAGEWVKIKRSVSQSILSSGLGDTIDAFVIGFTEGNKETGNEGLVGSIHFGIYLLGPGNEPIENQDGDFLIHHIATVSGISQELREAISTKDIYGNVALKPEIYGRVASIDGQDLSSRSLRFTHAILIGWREDRSADTCRIRKDTLEKLVL